MESKQDDRSLVRAVVEQRDEAALACLISRYGSLVRAIARSRGAGGMADDVAQEVFLTLWRRADDVLAHPAPAAWLHRATVYVTSRQHEAERARRQREQAYAASQDQVAVPREGDDRIEQLHACIAELPPIYREAIVFHHVLGLDEAACAERAGCQRGTMSWRLNEGRKQLKRRLCRHRLGLAALALLTPGVSVAGESESLDLARQVVQNVHAADPPWIGEGPAVARYVVVGAIIVAGLLGSAGIAWWIGAADPARTEVVYPSTAIPLPRRDVARPLATDPEMAHPSTAIPLPQGLPANIHEGDGGQGRTGCLIGRFGSGPSVVVWQDDPLPSAIQSTMEALARQLPGRCCVVGGDASIQTVGPAGWVTAEVPAERLKRSVPGMASGNSGR